MATVNGKRVLYNALTDAMSILDMRVATLYQNCTPQQIKHSHPQFHRFMVDRKFLVPEDHDESLECIQNWESEDTKSQVFSITINPTLDCNMRCWYCYENHTRQQLMSVEVRDSLYKFINNKLSQDHITKLHLTFFRGEPLLAFENCVMQILSFAHRECMARGKTLSLTFVTNGFLLTDKIMESLAEYGCKVHFQITLDGNRPHHDAVRRCADGTGSFDTIIRNIASTIGNEDFSYTIRLNYTHKNILSFLDLIPIFREMPNFRNSNITFDFQQVWQDYGHDDGIQENLKHVQQAFSDADLICTVGGECYKYRCYADRGNHIGLNFDGTVFHCTARDFTVQNSTGTLNTNGEISLNDRGRLHNLKKWGSTACHQCKAYPLCHGNCSQRLIEAQESNGCPLGFSQSHILAILDKRIVTILNCSGSGKVSIE